MDDRLKVEVDRNYDFFQRNLAGLLLEYAGQYALLKSQEIIGFFDKPGDAYRAGLARYPDHEFSVQEVVSEPMELGIFSVALA